MLCRKASVTFSQVCRGVTMNANKDAALYSTLRLF